MLFRSQRGNEVDFYKVRERLGNLFYTDVGIVREKSALLHALAEVETYINDIPRMGVGDTSKVYNTNKIEFLEFKNMLVLSRLILLSAISRDESRGAHYRIDKPQTDDAFAMHTIICKDGVVS